MKRTEIHYGPYFGKHWLPLRSKKDQHVQEYLMRIKPILEMNDLHLTLCGGILEPWATYDLDGILTGTYNPEKIKIAMHLMTQIGFSMNILPDLKYQRYGEVFKWSHWKRYGEPRTIEYATPFYCRQWDGQQVCRGEERDGLYWTSITWPLAKTLNRKHDYQDPWFFA